MSDKLFGHRHGFLGPKPITYRGELPQNIQRPLVETLLFHTSDLYLGRMCCDLFDPFDTGARAFFDRKPSDLSASLYWFEVFSLIEHVYVELHKGDRGKRLMKQAAPFRKHINDFFTHEGVGWTLNKKGELVSVGDEQYEHTLATAITSLKKSDRPTAADHLESSKRALSGKPKPDTAGAVTHATSAIECVLHSVTGDPMALSGYLRDHANLLHPAVIKALAPIYGYASDTARHGKEGKEPSFEEAQFVISVCAAVCTLLASQHPSKLTEK